MDRPDHILADPPSAHLVLDEFLAERLKLRALVRFGRPVRSEGGRLHNHEVFKWSRGRLRPRVDPMSNGPALHGDDRMVAVLASDGRRQSHNESRLGLSDDLFETMR